MKQLSEKLKVDFFGNPSEKNAAKIVEQGMQKLKDCNLLIVDSAGRNALDDELVRELKAIEKIFSAQQRWLVLTADIGQIAKKQAQAFHDAVGINGVIITRMDGSAKGGGALAACKTTNSPVYFIGIGEKSDDLQEFDAQRYLSRVMGYGDLQGLLEKIKEAEMPEMDLGELTKGSFNLEIFYQQLKAAKSLGPLDKVAEMLGMKMQIPKEALDVSEQKMNGFKVIIDSMTKGERLEPEILSHSRILRIAKGSGKREQEVRELLSHYKKMEKVWRQFSKLGEVTDLKEGKLQKMLQKIGGIGKKKKVKLR